MRATTSQEERLVYTYEDGVSAPYLEPPFRADFVRQAHEEFGHLGHPGLNGVLRGRGWWPSMRTDVEETVRRCPNCQIAQGSKESLERESAQYLAQAGVKPFER